MGIIKKKFVLIVTSWQLFLFSQYQIANAQSFARQRFDHDNGRQKISIIPFGSAQENEADQFSLHTEEEITSQSQNSNLIANLKTLGLSERWEISIYNQIHHSNGSFSASVNFSWQGIKLCGFYANYHNFSDRKSFVIGEIPTLSPDETVDPSTPWPLLSLATDLVFAEINTSFSIDSVKRKSGEKCLYALNGNWIPIWEIIATDEWGRSFLAFADDTNVYEVNPQFLHVQGSVKGYNTNAKDGKLVTENVTLNATGYLDSTYFSTDPKGYARAQSGNYIFDVDPSDPTFPEINVFLHATRMMTWFIDQGYQLHSMPIQIQLHQAINGSVNNALYLPAANDSTSPRILIGDGDGRILKDLALDGDVVSHELGHHIVFRYLKSTSQVETREKDPDNMDHSLALHEGLADFFTFARTDNACLGESICPENTENSICFRKAICLRTADNTINYRSDEYWNFGTLAHLKGQLVSGLLWEMRNSGTISKDQMHKLVVKSVEFLPRQATYKDFITALLLADKDLYQEQFHCFILSKSIARGFDQEVAQIGQEKCGGPPPTTGSGLSKETTDPTTDGQNTTSDGDSKKSRTKKFCGVIGNQNDEPSNTFFASWWLFAFLPPLVRMLGKRKSN